MRELTRNFAACFAMALSSLLPATKASGQAAATPPVNSLAPNDASQLIQQVLTISSALAATRSQLEESQRKIQQLQEQLIEVEGKLNTYKTSSSTSIPAAIEKPPVDADLQERVETLEAQVKLHDQTKLESGSKYPVRVSGLFLFNSFVNRGAVDNFDLPSIATGSTARGADGGVGAGLKQTILGIEATGPRIGGAKTSAKLNVDFFGGIPYSSYGTVSGILRLRTASINLDWSQDSLQLGLEMPLISPLSPTSYSTVGEPGMAWAGNLWTWAPQLRLAHQIFKTTDHRLQAEFGLWDPPASGYNSTTNVFRTPSAGELSNQPAYESRISYASSSSDRTLQIGASGYYSRQRRQVTASGYPDRYWTNDSWAFTTDFRIPLSHGFELSGEGYRGRSLGGLGGGLYKDVLYGTNPLTGVLTVRGVNDIGGWTQFKSRFGQIVETNASIGLDNDFASDFHALTLPANASATQLLARNRMVVGNVIYRPKTYLIFSPEYRRIWTWPIFGSRSIADIYTFSVGYQF
jgi:chaperonin cofactor prefoldin